MSTTDTSTFTTITASGIATASILFFQEAVTHMLPWLICAVPLILLDLNFGIKAARYRKEAVRFSRAFRRTFGKVVEYFAWVCFAATASLAFEVKWVEMVVLGAVYVNELASIVGNCLETKGLKVNWKYVVDTVFKLGGQKVGVDASDVDSSQFIEPINKPKPGRNAKGQFVSKKGGLK